MDLSKVGHDLVIMAFITDLADGLDRSHSVLFDRVCLIHCRTGAKGLDAYRRDSESDTITSGE
jgi:hypothetical protein